MEIIESVYRLRDEFLHLHSEYKSCGDGGRDSGSQQEGVAEATESGQHDGQTEDRSGPTTKDSVVDSMLRILTDIVALIAKHSEECNKAADSVTLSTDVARRHRRADSKSKNGRKKSLNAETMNLLLNPEVRLDEAQQPVDGTARQMPDEFDPSRVKREPRSDEDHQDSCSGSDSSDDISGSDSEADDYSSCNSDLKEEGGDASDDSASKKIKNRLKKLKMKENKTNGQMPDWANDLQLIPVSESGPPKKRKKKSEVRLQANNWWGPERQVFEEEGWNWIIDRVVVPQHRITAYHENRKKKKNDPRFQHIFPEEKQDLFLFYIKHKDRTPVNLIVSKITKKYKITKSTVYRVIKAGLAGRSFDRKPNSTPGKGNVVKRPEMVQEMVEYAKTNPFTTATFLAQKYGGMSTSTVCRLLEKAGVKILSSAERRAIKMNMEGKEYTPFYSPEVAQYNRIQKKLRMQRLKEGDTTDGRSARHTDPNWKSLKEIAGVPVGEVVYPKEYVKERPRNASISPRKPRISRPRKKKTPKEAGLQTSVLQLTGGDHHRSESNISAATTSTSIQITGGDQNHSHLHSPQHAQHHSPHAMSFPVSSSAPPLPHVTQSTRNVAAGWNLQFDPTTGGLYNAMQHSYGPAAAAVGLSAAAAAAAHQQGSSGGGNPFGGYGNLQPTPSTSSSSVVNYSQPYL